MNAARRHRSSPRPLIVFCLSVLFASAAGLGWLPNDPLVGSLSTYAFLAAVVGLLGANLLTIFRPPGTGDEDSAN